jgi:tetratricopeptide (TPR) repeat protein
MKATYLRFSVVAAVVLAVGLIFFVSLPRSRISWSVLQSSGQYAPIKIEHPLEGAEMPWNMPAPVVFWKTNGDSAVHWAAGFKAGSQQWVFADIYPRWHPQEAQWRSMKDAAKGAITLTLAEYRARDPRHLLARSSVRFAISPDSVDYPIFYREVNLPFSEAVKDPSHIRWRFGSITNRSGPPIVLSHLPVCGNCHSFTADGRYLAMDVDYANSKASYVITRTAPQMRLATSDIISWDDYRRKDGQQTFGLLSQISPDGRYVLSTVKDRSVFVARPDLAFSQLFFPIQGIVAVYDRVERRFFALPGADDPRYVQSNPTWSPDGKWVVFARNRAAKLEKPVGGSQILLRPEQCEEFLKGGKSFKFDLYRLPFNGGKGGTAKPLLGASKNGRSNYFPKFSPDGRWIVFCQASNYMLLQPDSELYIIPSEGGKARRLGCNLWRMNSWHSWSPDGKWLVFSSKAFSPYTQLCLTRMSKDGQASPPVWLAQMVAPGRAANIPEFVNLPPTGIVRIHEQFLDDYSYTRAGDAFFRGGDIPHAIEKFKLALSMNPNNAMAQQRLGFLLLHAEHRLPEAQQHLEKAIELEPHNAFAQFDLGTLLAIRGDLTNAIVHLEEAVRLLPNGYDRQYNVVDMNFGLAETRYRLGQYANCIPSLQIVLNHDPTHARANLLMAMAKAWLGETETTLPYFEAAVHSDPRLGQLPDYYDLISRNYVNQGLFAKGLKASERGFQLATSAGRAEQAAQLRQRAQYCQMHM